MESVQGSKYHLRFGGSGPLKNLLVLISNVMCGELYAADVSYAKPRLVLWFPPLTTPTKSNPTVLYGFVGRGSQQHDVFSTISPPNRRKCNRD